MATTTLTSPASPASTTPVRERWVDLCRATALSVVILGHVLISVVHRDVDGALHVTSLLDIAGWTHPVTWVVQVMAVFFAVGGYAAAGSVRDKGVTDRRTWATWTSRRTVGLLVPALPLLVVWLLAGPFLPTLVPGEAGVRLAGIASSAALVPLWFLATYVVVQALVPVWVAVVDAGRATVTVLGLLGAVALVDIAHLHGAPVVGYLNFLLVWSIPTLLGVAVHSHRHAGRSLPDLRLVAVVGVAGAVGLVLLAGYSVPVVGVTGAARSNNSPPSLLLALHGLAYAAAVLHLGPRLERRLAAGAASRPMGLLATWSMPLYLWHMTALVLMGAAGILAGSVPLSASWWLLRPATVAVVLALTLLLIMVVSGPTRALTRRAVAADVGPGVTAVGLLACAAGVGVIVSAGTVTTPWVGVGLLALGLAALTTPRSA